MSDFSLMNHDPLPASGQGASAGTASAPLGSQITLMLRIEGLATLALATQAYYRLGWDWRLYAALFLLPDISLAGYLFGRKTGAWAYNVVHVYNLPIILGILGADPEVRNGFSGIDVRFDIDADATPDEIEALVAQSQKRSAVFDIVTNPTNVSVSVG